MVNKYLNAMRSTALQAICHAGQGHTGMAISAIPLVYTVYQNMHFSKAHPKWINRDRFVLSAGHGSMSLYSLFYLSGLLSEDDILHYRQADSLTPGHPEIEPHNYIDCSTGPLGQGIATAVGMAIAEKYLNYQYRKLKGLINHYTYVIVGDGDLQEGICYEAMSLAGKLKLNKLIVLHDSNDFQLDSAVKVVNSENLKKRVEAQNWTYLTCDNDVNNIDACIKKAQANKKPTFIEVKTIIGEGTSAANSFKAHGLKVTSDEIKAANTHFAMDYQNLKFDQAIFDHFKTTMIDRGEKAYQAWDTQYQNFKKENPQLIETFETSLNPTYINKKMTAVLNALASKTDVVPTKTYFKELFALTKEKKIHDILTLSADLASTTNCKNDDKSFNETPSSPYVMVGIREFSMAAIQNGILLHQGLRSFCGTFLSFADYMKPAMRLGALMQLPSYYILTHDSYLVGGDGPTHQPYDQLPMLRAIENVYDIRPANRAEFVAGLEKALATTKDTYCFVMTRQNVDVTPTKVDLTNGAYFYHYEKDAQYTIIANGSELELVTKNIDTIKKQLNASINIISAPMPKLFLQTLNQQQDMQKHLQSQKGVLVVEASSDNSWYQLLKYQKHLALIQANTFGKSMDGNKLYEQKGFSVDNIINQLKALKDSYEH